MLFRSTNFTTSLADSYASCHLTCKDDGSGNGNGTQNAIHYTNGVLSTSLSIGCYNWGGSWYDLATICVAAFR